MRWETNGVNGKKKIKMVSYSVLPKSMKEDVLSVLMAIRIKDKSQSFSVQIMRRIKNGTIF